MKTLTFHVEVTVPDNVSNEAVREDVGAGVMEFLDTKSSLDSVKLGWVHTNTKQKFPQH
jgi:hypothetical protein